MVCGHCCQLVWDLHCGPAGVCVCVCVCACVCVCVRERARERVSE